MFYIKLIYVIWILTIGVSKSTLARFLSYDLSSIIPLPPISAANPLTHTLRHSRYKHGGLHTLHSESSFSSTRTCTVSICSRKFRGLVWGYVVGWNRLVLHCFTHLRYLVMKLNKWKSYFHFKDKITSNM